MRQLVFYHTVLQVQKTLKSGSPEYLHKAVTGTYPRDTRSGANGQLRLGITWSTSSFKYRAVQAYNRVPGSVRDGSPATVKSKLKKWIKSNIPID